MSEQEFALVKDGELVHGPHGPVTIHRPDNDACGEWLPIENEDSAPFSLAEHWRLKPLPLRVEGGRVIRTYPIVTKAEHV